MPLVLKSAYRILMRGRILSAVKLLGLMLGCCVFLLTTLFSLSEWSYDKQHNRPETIYRYVHQVNTPEGMQSFAFSSATIGPLLKEKFSNIVDYTRFIQQRVSIRNEQSDVAFNENKFGFADSTFFDFFNFPVNSQPSSHHLLNKAQTVLLTPNTAARYFGSSDPTGKTLVLNGRIPLTVIGVFKEQPRNTHFEFDFLASMATLAVIGNDPIVAQQINVATKLDAKGYAAFYSYIRIADHTTPEEIVAKFPEFIEETRGKGRSERLKPTLQSLTSIHLQSNLLYEISQNGSEGIVWVYFIIGFLVLTIGCINYVNISTAEFIQRARTTSLKKILGVTRWSLLWGQLVETCVLSAIGLIGGLLLALIVLPYFNLVTDRNISLWTNETVIIALVIFVTTVLLSGLFPAVKIGQTSTLAAFRKSAMTSLSGRTLRDGLVLFQLITSFVLLTVSLLIYGQVDYLLNKTLGFDSGNIMVVNAGSVSPSQRQTMKHELMKTAGIDGVAMCSTPPGESLISFGLVLPEHDGDAERRILFYQSYVDEDFTKVMGVNLSAGRFFEQGSPGDSTRAIIMNDVGAKSIGGAVLNRSFDIPNLFTPGNTRKEVLGLINDFNFASLHATVQPLVLEYNPTRCGYLMLRLAPGSASEAIEASENTWRQLQPEIPFDYYFIEDEFQNDFANEQRLKSIVFAIATISIVLAALGIFGSTLFMVQSKTKEVAIRKVHGSDRGRLMLLLFWPSMLLLAIASIIGMPIAYLSGVEWLNGYPYRVEFSTLWFVFSFGVILIVMIGAIVYHLIKVTSVNPVVVLKQDH
ncbi:MAG TPA: ABC transporter permease [Cyclobacteriaceae bacterium]|nr:ABC transporter permease [Cyclobacteriaceae bacterium]